MEYLFANTVDSLINVFFKGGVEEFDKLGRITIIPHPAKEICIYHPELSEDVVKKLKALENNKGLNTIHIMSEKNFPDTDDDQIRAINLDLNKKIERLDPSANILMCQKSNLVVLTFPDIRDTKDSILDLVFGLLRDIDGLRLGYVLTAQTVYKITPEKEQMKSKQIPKIDSKEHGIISQDDITNLIIDLERSESSEDLLQ